MLKDFVDPDEVDFFEVLLPYRITFHYALQKLSCTLAPFFDQDRQYFCFKEFSPSSLNNYRRFVFQFFDQA